MFVLSDYCMLIYMAAVEWTLKGKPNTLPTITWDEMRELQMAAQYLNERPMISGERTVYYMGKLHRVEGRR